MDTLIYRTLFKYSNRTTVSAKYLKLFLQFDVWLIDGWIIEGLLYAIVKSNISTEALQVCVGINGKKDQLHEGYIFRILLYKLHLAFMMAVSQRYNIIALDKFT